MLFVNLNNRKRKVVVFIFSGSGCCETPSGQVWYIGPVYLDACKNRFFWTQTCGASAADPCCHAVSMVAVSGSAFILCRKQLAPVSKWDFMTYWWRAAAVPGGAALAASASWCGPTRFGSVQVSLEADCTLTEQPNGKNKNWMLHSRNESVLLPVFPL